MIKVYLAGGMKSGWQDRVISKSAIFYDPRSSGLNNPDDYTKWELDHVHDCDIVFAYLEKDNPSSIGMSVEIGYAKALSKTIILVREKSHYRFDILESCADKTFTILQDGIKELSDFVND